MEFNEEIELISFTTIQNDMGDTIKVKSERKVLASKLDYRNKDFYQAMANGLKPSITFGINKFEYQDEKELMFEGKGYKIIDVAPIKEKYTNEFETVSLMCEGLVNK